jgi:hypothetical protein
MLACQLIAYTWLSANAAILAAGDDLVRRSDQLHVNDFSAVPDNPGSELMTVAGSDPLNAGSAKDFRSAEIRSRR